MVKSRAWLGITGAFGLVALLACSSSSGGGGGNGGCADMSGSWTMGGNCQSNPSTCTVTQTNCTATLSCDTGSASATVSGNSMSFTFQGAQCNGSVSNQQFSGSCTASGSSCDVSGSCSNGKCGTSQSSGGAGGSGGGEGGSGGVPPGGAGGVSGSGGGPGECGGTLYSNTPACQSCMETSCCSQLAACAVGTPCDALFNCIVTYCSEDPSEQCLTTNCSEQLSSGGQPFLDMFDCEEASCASACADA